MNCPKCGLIAYKFGFTPNKNLGPIQRFRCPWCGTTFNGRNATTNRLPQSKIDAVIKLLQSGASKRSVAKLVGVTKTTVWKLGMTVVLPPKSPPSGPKRDRSEYLSRYYIDAGITAHYRNERREIVRGHLALWLAKNKEPMNIDKIFAAISVSFPHLKRYSVINMLKQDVEDCFKKSGDKFTYQPPEIYFPLLSEGRPNRWPGRMLMEQARAVWFDVRGLRDELTENAIARIKNNNVQFLKAKKSEAIQSSIKTLRLMATASQIANYEANCIQH